MKQKFLTQILYKVRTHTMPPASASVSDCGRSEVTAEPYSPRVLRYTGTNISSEEKNFTLKTEAENSNKTLVPIDL
jgi:hypothetical protein